MEGREACNTWQSGSMCSAWYNLCMCVYPQDLTDSQKKSNALMEELEALLHSSESLPQAAPAPPPLVPRPPAASASMRRRSTTFVPPARPTPPCATSQSMRRCSVTNFAFDGPTHMPGRRATEEPAYAWSAVSTILRLRTGMQHMWSVSVMRVSLMCGSHCQVQCSMHAYDARSSNTS